VGSFAPLLIWVEPGPTWLTMDVPDGLELLLDELLESGEQPARKRRTAPAKTAASL
jgi:hypothetical protein